MNQNCTTSRHKAFKDAVKTKFRVINNDNIKDFDLTLEEVSDSRELGNKYEGFNATFTSPKSKGGYLPQHTWELSNSLLDVISIFLVPIGETETEYKYQCVFNYEIES